VPSPEDFTIIVQGPDGNGVERCRGFAEAPVVVPARVWVVADDGMTGEASALTDDLWRALSEVCSDADSCRGPAGPGCWATDSPTAHNVMVAVCGSQGYGLRLERTVRNWLAAGSVAIGVLPEGADPQQSLPPSLRSSVAIRYRSSVTESTDEVVDLLLLANEERRAFISYAHVDGSDVAYALFEALARRRFDVYLDRFRTAPSTDFVERIDDELRDKAMVVVVESAGSAASTWVLHEVMVARQRGYGLLALNVGQRRQHPAIPAGRRLEVGTFDEDVVCSEIERHYRAAVLDQRLRRTRTVEAALRWAARRNPGLQVRPNGERCDLTGGPVDYAVLGSFRPAGVRQARRIAELAEIAGRRPVVYCPRPARRSNQQDLGWLDDETPVAVVPDGRLLRAVRDMEVGVL
jgi:hypothetical protein